METTVVIAICSLILFAFFSGMEAAFISSNKLRLELDKLQGGFHAQIIKLLTKHPSQLIATILAGITLSLVSFCLSASISIAPFLSQVTGSSVSLSLLIACFGFTAVLLILGDTIPKALSRTNPNAFLRFFAIPTLAFYVILYLIAKPIGWLAKFSFRARRRSKKEGISPFEKHDLLRMADELGNQNDEGEHQQEIEIFRNALDFSEVRVRDCMIPRTEIEGVDVSSSKAELTKLFIQSGFSRILAYDDSVDNIVGYVHTKDLFEEGKTIKQLLRPIDFVPENMPAQKLLAKFIKEQKSIAIVVDEFGGTMGMLTIEDILEEIIGEIDDEHDMDELTERQLDENRFILSGRLEVEELNGKYGLDIPESDEYETLAGYIIHKNEQLPKPKETLKIDRFTIRILQMSAKQVNLVELTIHH